MKPMKTFVLASVRLRFCSKHLPTSLLNLLGIRHGGTSYVLYIAVTFFLIICNITLI